MLSTVRIEAVNGVLTVIGNNLDEYATSSTECKGDLSACCISESQLTNIISLLPDEIEVTLDKQLCFGKDFKLNFMPAAEFPAWQQIKVEKMGLPCPDLAEAIKSVRFAASRDKNNENRHGVRIICDHKKVSAESFSGTEFARCTKILIGVPANFFLPLAFASSFCEALNQPESVLSLSENIAMVKYKNGEYGCKLSGGSHLNIDDTLNKTRTTIGEIHVEKWLPIFIAAIGIGGMDAKISCQVVIESKRIKYSGLGGEICPELPEPLKIEETPLKVNAATFSRCLSAFNGSPVSVELMQDRAIYMKSGDLIVCTTQML